MQVIRTFLCRLLGHDFVPRMEFTFDSDVDVTDFRPLWTCARCGQAKS
jgi:hypothetical protein